jgi:NAD-dependent protein deacetylase/lipoamidase
LAENMDILQRIGAKLGTASRITVLTGAGISAASGIPTFRGSEDSLWENSRPEELATMDAFNRDPEKVWRWYDWRRGLINDCEPNAAHTALADLEKSVGRLTIITQNVDGLHQRAGSGKVLEFHGSIWTLRCMRCDNEFQSDASPETLPPHCEKCNGLLRPGVVWFGEAIDPVIMEASVREAGACDYFLVIGTSGLVHPAAAMAQIAHDCGATVLEFNLEQGGVSAWVDHFIAGPAEDTVPGLLP